MSEPTPQPRREVRRLTQAIRQHREAGGDLPNAEELTAFLVGRNVPDPMVMVWQDGTLDVSVPEGVTTQKLVAALDAVDPVTLPANRQQRRAAILDALGAILRDVEATPEAERTRAESGLLLLARLERLDRGG